MTIHHARAIITTETAPLIGIPYADGVRYFVSEHAADEASAVDYDVQAVLSTAGTASDLDLTQMLAELEHLDKAVPPTPVVDTL